MTIDALPARHGSQPPITRLQIVLLALGCGVFAAVLEMVTGQHGPDGRSPIAINRDVKTGSTLHDAWVSVAKQGGWCAFDHVYPGSVQTAACILKTSSMMSFKALPGSWVIYQMDVSAGPASPLTIASVNAAYGTSFSPTSCFDESFLLPDGQRLGACMEEKGLKLRYTDDRLANGYLTD